VDYFILATILHSWMDSNKSDLLKPHDITFHQRELYPGTITSKLFFIKHYISTYYVQMQ